jgi:hypothetical protein
MTPEQARARLRYLAAERERNTAAEPEAILDAIKAGVRPTDIAADIGRTREHVRRIREHAKSTGLLPAERADT